LLIFFGFFEIITGYNVLSINLDIFYKILDGKFLPTNERISIFFNDEKILGGFLLRWIILFCALFLYNFGYGNKKEFYKFIIIFLLTSILIFSSGERSSVFLYFLFIGCAFLVIKIDFKKKIILVLSILLTFAFLVQITPELKRRLFEHVLEYGFRENNSWHFFSMQHEAHYKSAFKIFLNNPYFGSGVKTFRYECKKPENSIKFNSVGGCATHPHNTYMQLLAETGLFGFIFFAFFLFFSGIKILKDSFFKKIEINLRTAYCKSFLNIHFFVFLWPLIPTGSLFHNWTLTGYIFPLGFLIYFIEQNFFYRAKNKS